MQSTIIITPTTNIKNNAVVNNDKVETRTYDTRMDFFTVYNNHCEETRRTNLIDISIYDDVIVEGDTDYVILRMLSK